MRSTVIVSPVTPPRFTAVATNRSAVPLPGADMAGGAAVAGLAAAGLAAAGLAPEGAAGGAPFAAGATGVAGAGLAGGFWPVCAKAGVTARMLARASAPAEWPRNSELNCIRIIL